MERVTINRRQCLPVLLQSSVFAIQNYFFTFVLSLDFLTKDSILNSFKRRRTLSWSHYSVKSKHTDVIDRFIVTYHSVRCPSRKNVHIFYRWFLGATQCHAFLSKVSLSHTRPQISDWNWRLNCIFLIGGGCCRWVPRAVVKYNTLLQPWPSTSLSAPSSSLTTLIPGSRSQIRLYGFYKRPLQ